MPTPRDVERFWSKVARAEGDGCWEWQKSITDGYGMFWVKDYDVSAMTVDRVVSWRTWRHLEENA